jgi:hypothetical protein
MLTQYTCLECGCFLETGEESNFDERWNHRPTEDKLREALGSCLEELETYYHLFPNAHRKTFKEYFAEELQALAG